MGLIIGVGGELFYQHSYHDIHLLRGFAARKERLDLTSKPLFGENRRPTFYDRPYDRFKALIDHPDAEGGYVPEGVSSPVLRGVPDDEMHWQSSEELLKELKELKDLAQYRDEMDEIQQELLDELMAAAEASVRLKLIMLFV
jgi:hypothetical protein